VTTMCEKRMPARVGKKLGGREPLANLSTVRAGRGRLWMICFATAGDVRD